MFLLFRTTQYITSLRQQPAALISYLHASATLEGFETVVYSLQLGTLGTVSSTEPYKFSLKAINVDMA